jgi:hypothetical protein
MHYIGLFLLLSYFVSAYTVVKLNHKNIYKNIYLIDTLTCIGCIILPIIIVNFPIYYPISNYIDYILRFAICISSIIGYHHLLPLISIYDQTDIYKDKSLQKKLDYAYNLNIGFTLNGWSLIHIIFYMAMVLKFPHYNIITFICGIGWELFEFLLFLFLKYVKKNKPDDIWWYYDLRDLVANTIGMTIGILIIKYFY